MLSDDDEEEKAFEDIDLDKLSQDYYEEELSRSRLNSINEILANIEGSN